MCNLQADPGIYVNPDRVIRTREETNRTEKGGEIPQCVRRRGNDTGYKTSSKSPARSRITVDGGVGFPSGNKRNDPIQDRGINARRDDP